MLVSAHYRKDSSHLNLIILEEEEERAGGLKMERE